MNKIVLIGNLTNDPELRTTANGTPVCSFSIAVNRRFQTANGEKVTDFFRISVWRQAAESCSKYLSKGRKVAVVGELQARTYEGNDGKTRMALDVSADEVEFLSPRGEASGSASQEIYSPMENASSARKNESAPSGFVEVDDELPF